MISQRLFNLMKSMVNIDAMVQDGYSAAYILETIQIACKRQHRECPLSEMDVVAAIKLIELSESQPFFPNRDIQDVRQRQDNMDKYVAEEESFSFDGNYVRN